MGFFRILVLAVAHLARYSVAELTLGALTGASIYLDAGWWFGTFFIFPYIGNVIIPIDFHIFQRGRAQPPTSI